MNETSPLKKAAALAWNKLGYSQEKPYMPHLSLVYGDLTIEKREQLTKDFQLKDLEKGFVASALSLWYTPIEDKSLASWMLIERFPLAGR